MFLLGLNMHAIPVIKCIESLYVFSLLRYTCHFLFYKTDALTLLTEATDFMAIQFTSNSTHDTKLAKNVSSGLLNSIGSVLQISSRDAKVETKDNFIKEKVDEIVFHQLLNLI